jgi:hypothetical protein
MRFCDPGGTHEAESPGVVQLAGSLIALEVLTTVYDGIPITVTSPENSEVLPPSRAVAVSCDPAVTPPGVGTLNAKRVVVSVPWSTPLIAAGP